MVRAGWPVRVLARCFRTYRVPGLDLRTVGSRRLPRVEEPDVLEVAGVW
jgi:hypothetical protein